MFNEVKKLAQIYNTLSLISTKGKDTMYMALCLEALKDVYEKLSAIEDKTEENTEEETIEI